MGHRCFTAQSSLFKMLSKTRENISIEMQVPRNGTTFIIPVSWFRLTIICVIASCMLSTGMMEHSPSANALWSSGKIVELHLHDKNQAIISQSHTIRYDMTI